VVSAKCYMVVDNPVPASDHGALFTDQGRDLGLNRFLGCGLLLPSLRPVRCQNSTSGVPWFARIGVAPKFSAASIMRFHSGTSAWHGLALMVVGTTSLGYFCMECKVGA